MFNTDIIKTYIFKPNYEYKKLNIYCDLLKIFNNNIYSYIKIYDNLLIKIKQIKQNYIIFSYITYCNYINFCIINKIINCDKTKIDFNIDYESIFSYNERIENNEIIKKLDKHIYIIYYHKKYILKNIRHHKFYNSKYYYEKKYITYYINYYIIIYNDIKKNYINKLRNCNTILCNFSRNFMLFI